MTDHEVVAALRRWVETVVVDLNLCPFAKRELLADRVRFVATTASTEQALLETLSSELERLTTTPSIETTLVIHPNVLTDFHDYNQFLDSADRLLVALELEGVFQIASFHPDYQFAGTGNDDAENFTNRSPYPVLHLLQEESLEKAIENTPDLGGVPDRNIETMNRVGVEKLRATLAACLR